MNRTKKSYCSHGEHLRWRHWRDNGVYTKEGFAHKVQCVECGAPLSCEQTRGSYWMAANFVTMSRKWRGIGPLPEHLNNRLMSFRIPSRHFKLNRKQVAAYAR